MATYFDGEKIEPEILIESKLYYKEDAIKELGEIDETVPPPVPDNFSNESVEAKE